MMKFTVVFLLVIFVCHLNAKNATTEDIALVLLRRLLGEIDQMKETISFQTALIDRKDEVINSLQQKVNNIDKKVKEQSQSTKGTNQWVLQSSNVCFGARDNKPGKFSLQQDGKLTALKLVHKSGFVACARGEQYKSNWGCVHPQVDLGVYITDINDRPIFPKHATHPVQVAWYKRAWYFMPGYSAVSPVLVFTDMSSPMYGRKGQEVRIWYGEDLINYSEENDFGTSCADVYAQFS